MVGAGQAGLSAGYFLPRFGVEDYVLLDHYPGPGGAWSRRWPSLTLRAANRVHDLPGWGLQEALGSDCDDIPAADGVAAYFGAYEDRFSLPVRRPAHVSTVTRTSDPDHPYGVAFIEGGEEFTLRPAAVINCTGTWDRPFWPTVRGSGSFRGLQLHAHEYRTAEPFAGKTVAVVGAGISAVQLLIEISAVTDTVWFSRREPQWDEGPFDPDKGRRAVARVDERVRAGLPPGSVVSVTGLPLTPPMRAARDAGILAWNPMFAAMEPDGVVLADDTRRRVDVVLWCTGFRYSMDHLAPLGLRSPGGGIRMTGRLATEVAGEPRLHLLGYGPSASTIGANRAGREAARAIAALVTG